MKRVVGAVVVLALIAGLATSAIVVRGGPEPDSARGRQPSHAGASGVVLTNLDFDTCNTSQWTETQAIPGRITYPRSGTPTPRQGRGHCMARIELRSGDDPIRSGGERSEFVLRGTAAGAQNGLGRWYGWSVFVPTSNPALTSGFNIFTQFHGPGGTDQPNVSLDLSGNIRIYGVCNNCGQGSRNVGAHPRGRWVDWLLHIVWSDGPSGRITVFRDGTRVWDDAGPNLYSGASAYLKQGYYRRRGDTFVLYLDRTRIGTTRAAVAPGRTSPPVPTPTPPPPAPPPAPGTVTVSQTLTGGTLTGTAPWRATVTGCSPKPTKVEFFVGDTLVLTEINAPFGDTVGFWDSASVPNGRYSLRARATCPAGVFTSPTAVVTVAN